MVSRRGARRAPRSSALIASRLRWARPANSPWLSPTARRALRNSGPKVKAGDVLIAVSTLPVLKERQTASLEDAAIVADWRIEAKRLCATLYAALYALSLERPPAVRHIGNNDSTCCGVASGH